MADLDKAIAAAREAVRGYYETTEETECSATIIKAADRMEEACRAAFDALDAARPQAVAWVKPHELEFIAEDGHASIVVYATDKNSSRVPLYAAPPAPPAAAVSAAPVAWVHKDDPMLAISGMTKARMLDGGSASAAAALPYSVAAYADPPAAAVPDDVARDAELFRALLAKAETMKFVSSTGLFFPVVTLKSYLPGGIDYGDDYRAAIAAELLAAAGKENTNG